MKKQKEIDRLLEDWEDNKNPLSVELALLDDPVSMFVSTKSAHIDRNFMKDNKLWRQTAMIYFPKHVKKTGDENSLEHFETFISKTNINYFRMMLALHLVKYHLFVNNRDNTISFQSVSEITTYLKKLLHNGEEHPRFYSKLIKFQFPETRVDFSLQLVVEFGNDGEIEHSIYIKSEYLLGLVSSFRYYGQLYFRQDFDPGLGWAYSEPSPKWSSTEELFALIYNLLQNLEGLFVLMPFNKDAPVFINKKIVL
jgi:hypothetical protein